MPCESLGRKQIKNKTKQKQNKKHSINTNSQFSLNWETAFRLTQDVMSINTCPLLMVQFLLCSLPHIAGHLNFDIFNNYWFW